MSKSGSVKISRNALVKVIFLLVKSRRVFFTFHRLDTELWIIDSE